MLSSTHYELLYKLEDLKVLRRSPDLLNNVKIGQGQLQLLMEQILFLPYILKDFKNAPPA